MLPETKQIKRGGAPCITKDYEEQKTVASLQLNKRMYNDQYIYHIYNLQVSLILGN